MKKVTTVDEYLAEVAEPAHSTLQKIRTMIWAAAPKGATEAISYGIPAFKYKGGLVGYAAFKEHCSFFPLSGKLIQTVEADLAKYKTSKGTIQFPVDKPLPAALVKKLVKARVLENESKSKR